jgi:LytS/YehU family sensor histidine kinase
MNPHFLYNVLNTVQGLVYANKKNEASEILGNFSDLMRRMLEASEMQFISLHDEITNLRLYLDLEKARFNHEFNYTIHLQNIHESEQLFLPSLLIQPFAEKAIKHGHLHKKGEKQLVITFALADSWLTVVIDDNGIGREQSSVINLRQAVRTTKFSTKAAQSRIRLLNQVSKQPITLTTTDKKDTESKSLGTQVCLRMAIQQKPVHISYSYDHE